MLGRSWSGLPGVGLAPAGWCWVGIGPRWSGRPRLFWPSVIVRVRPGSSASVRRGGDVGLPLRPGPRLFVPGVGLLPVCCRLGGDRSALVRGRPRSSGIGRGCPPRSVVFAAVRGRPRSFGVVRTRLVRPPAPRVRSAVRVRGRLPGSVVLFGGVRRVRPRPGSAGRSPGPVSVRVRPWLSAFVRWAGRGGCCALVRAPGAQAGPAGRPFGGCPRLSAGPPLRLGPCCPRRPSGRRVGVVAASRGRSWLSGGRRRPGPAGCSAAGGRFGWWGVQVVVWCCWYQVMRVSRSR